MIYSLQTLRALGAIFIVIHHLGFKNSIVASMGDCAVSIFMMLSGFVLTAAFYDRAKRKQLPSFRSFIIKRLVKIYPLYFVGMLFMMGLDKFHISPKIAAADFLMLQSWVPDNNWFFSANAPLWFVSDLMLCYCLFLPVLKVLVGNRQFFKYSVARFIPLIYIYIYINCAIRPGFLSPSYNLHPTVNAVSCLCHRDASIYFI